MKQMKQLTQMTQITKMNPTPNIISNSPSNLIPLNTFAFFPFAVICYYFKFPFLHPAYVLSYVNLRQAPWYNESSYDTSNTNIWLKLPNKNFNFTSTDLATLHLFASNHPVYFYNLSPNLKAYFLLTTNWVSDMNTYYTLNNMTHTLFQAVHNVYFNILTYTTFTYRYLVYSTAPDDINLLLSVKKWKKQNEYLVSFDQKLPLVVVDLKKQLVLNWYNNKPNLQFFPLSATTLNTLNWCLKYFSYDINGLLDEFSIVLQQLLQNPIPLCLTWETQKRKTEIFYTKAQKLNKDCLKLIQTLKGPYENGTNEHNN